MRACVQVLLSGFGLHLRDACPRRPGGRSLREFVNISDPVAAIMVQEVVCGAPLVWLDHAERRFLDNVDFLKPVLVRRTHARLNWQRSRARGSSPACRDASLSFCRQSRFVSPEASLLFFWIPRHRKRDVREPGRACERAAFSNARFYSNVLRRAKRRGEHNQKDFVAL